MRLKVLFDKESGDDRFSSGWGLCYALDDKFLLDTGEQFGYISRNAAQMNLDLAGIDKIIITHDHWDHTGGLWGLLEMNPDRTVYACPGFSEEFKNKVRGFSARLIEISGPEKIEGSLYSTGELVTEYKGDSLSEQALVLDKGEECVLLSGCAHPGIVTMVEKAREYFSKPVTKVIGGFHLLDKEKRYVECVIEQLKELGVKEVGATHCTGFDAQVLFEKAFGKSFIAVKIGMDLDL